MYDVLKATSLVINNIDDKVKQLEEHLGAKGCYFCRCFFHGGMSHIL